MDEKRRKKPQSTGKTRWVPLLLGSMLLLEGCGWSTASSSNVKDQTKQQTAQSGKGEDGKDKDAELTGDDTRKKDETMDSEHAIDGTGKKDGADSGQDSDGTGKKDGADSGQDSDGTGKKDGADSDETGKKDGAADSKDKADGSGGKGEADAGKEKGLSAEGEGKEQEEPARKTVTITATGDCTFACVQTHGYEGSFHEYYDNYGEEYFFKGVKDTFEEDDMTLINLECVLSTSNDRVEKTWNLKGKPEYTNVMTSSSVEACSLGNNHSSDYGPQSLKDTQDALDQAGILYGYNDHTAIYTSNEGVKVGIVSASLLSQTEKYENYIKEGIESLRNQGVDIVVACCHWGIEREYYPNDYQTKLAHKIIDWGADLLIGNHPHVLQGMEYYNGKIICYSLGNFCFGGNSNPSDKDTMMYQQTFTLENGKLLSDMDAKIIPCRLSSVNSHNDYQPTVARDEKKQSIIENMNRYSSPYSQLKIDEEGVLHIE